MNSKTLAALTFFALLAVSSAYGQTGRTTVSGNIPFQFTAGKQVFPAGDYQFVCDTGTPIVTVIRGGKGPGIFVPVMTQLAGAIHTTKEDAHLVFDVVDGNYYLSEIWSPGMEGLLIDATHGPHQHRIVNVPR